jgi:hypothetical protein
MRLLRAEVQLTLVEDSLPGRDQNIWKAVVIPDCKLAADGAGTGISAQAEDEDMLAEYVRRAAIKAYRDLAVACGVRVGPGWKL